MPARNQILDQVRKHQRDVPHPGAFTEGTIYDDPVAHFISVLAAIGGRCESVASADAATALLRSIPEYSTARQVYSGVPGIGASTFALEDVSDPHDLADVDFTVLPGQLAVAENAAIWVSTPDVRVRTLHFITQHLALVVPRTEVISNLHEAYERIDVTVHPFGTWISGPSKTADIEQSLVKGAHGARSLLVLLLDG